MKYYCKIAVLAFVLFGGNALAIPFVLHAASCCGVLQSQEETISAQVIDESGQVVRGAIVKVKGSKHEAKTNAKGIFKLKANVSDTLFVVAPARHPLKILVKDMQETKKITLKWLQSDDNESHMIVEEMPQFLFGSLADWISQNARYPESAIKNGEEGKILVTFMIEKDGSISSVRALPNRVGPPHSFALQQEAERVIRTMPRWKPGIQRGRTVRVSYTVPINFDLSDLKREH